MSDTRRWLAALCIAALGRFSWRRPWVLLKPAWAVLMSLVPGQQVDAAVKLSRDWHCERCVIWIPTTRTCGSPLVNPKEGCGCYTPHKNQWRDAKCWAREKRPDLNIGWPDELMYGD